MFQTKFDVEEILRERVNLIHLAQNIVNLEELVNKLTKLRNA
jgi:hypothetical protein